MALVYLGLGTNLGNKTANLNAAVSHISDEIAEVKARSSYHLTKALGFESDNLFLNAVLLVESNLLPLQILQITKQIEIKLGRTIKSSGFYSDRIIDIDILLYDNMIVDLPELKIPHPLITEREFVLLPLLEITHNLKHQVTEKNFSDYLERKRFLERKTHK